MNLIIWLIVGGVIGWLASIMMKTDGQQGIFLNIVVGIIGAMLGGWVLSPLVGISTINQNNFSLPALLVSFAAVFGGTVLFKKKLISINAAGGSSTEKVLHYRKALTIRWAMVEGAALFAIICFFTAGNYSFAALAAALIIYFALQSTNKLKIMLQLQLSEQEAAAL